MTNPNKTDLPPRSLSIASLRVEAYRSALSQLKKNGFSNDNYLAAQKGKIQELLEKSDNKLYIEFGGKLLFDFHAARILPGYDPNIKIQLLQELAEDIDIILCVNANDIERNKLRADFGIHYHEDVLKMIDDLRKRNLSITAVVITQYSEQSAAAAFKTRLEHNNIMVYTHPVIPGYPAEIDTIVSPNGYGACSYVETTKRIVIVTAPGPGSGKLATCLSQLYHEYQKGVKAVYAKFETFPVWDIPLDHPINVAYEAATIDLNDSNMIDFFHEEAYGISAVNYNRDLDAFPLLKRIMERITQKECIYKSPTDMGCNCIKQGIIDDEICREASKQEIIRRYYRTLCDYSIGSGAKENVDRAVLLMEKVNVTIQDRTVVSAAQATLEQARRDPDRGNHGIVCAAAIQLLDNRIITGTNSAYFHSATAAVIKAAKAIANIPDELLLISSPILNSIGEMKKQILLTEEPSLDVTELLVALAVSSPTSTIIAKALEVLPQLKGCEMHLTHIPTTGDQNGLRKLGIHFTYDPIPSSRNLFDM